MGNKPTKIQAATTGAFALFQEGEHVHWIFACPFCLTRQDSIDTDKELEVDCDSCDKLFFPVYPLVVPDVVEVKKECFIPC